MRGEIVAFPTCLIASPKRESNKGMTKAVSNQEKITSEMEVVLPRLHCFYWLHCTPGIDCTGLYRVVLGYTWLY